MAQGTTNLPDRFWRKVNKNGPDGIHSQTGENLGPCWLWMGAPSRGGYAQSRLGSPDGSKRMVHRAVYESLVGPFAEPELDHLCRVRNCVNPSHLEPVDHDTNMARGAHAMKTHCPKGHEYTPENTRAYRWPSGQEGRFCRTCQSLTRREQKRVLKLNRTACKMGHVFGPDAEVTADGRRRRWRYCAICNAARVARMKAKRAA